MTRGFEQALYETTREAAVADIARRYRECVEIFEEAPSRRGLGAMREQSTTELR